MIAKNQTFEKYQITVSIIFSILYYVNTALSLYVAEQSHNFTGFFTTFFVLYSFDKFLTFVIAKAWQHKQGFFTWIFDCFNLGFLAVIYYRKNKSIFKNMYRLKLLISILPMTILQIIYFFNQRILYNHASQDQSIVISQIGLTVFITNIIFIAFAFTNSLQKPNIYTQDHNTNLIRISLKKQLAVFFYNIVHFISYFGMWALLSTQKLIYNTNIPLAVIGASVTFLITLVETMIVKSPVPLLNIFFNHSHLTQKSLKNSLEHMKQNRIRPIRQYVQLLSMFLISIFLNKTNPFINSYEPIQGDTKVNILSLEIYRFEILVYILTFLCLMLNLKDLYESFTCYLIDEDCNKSFSAMTNTLLKNHRLQYIYLNTSNRSRSSSLNQFLLFDDEENQTRASISDSDIFENEEITKLKTALLDRLIQLQSQGGIVYINKTTQIKGDSFMIDKEIFNTNFMIKYLSEAKQLPINLSYKLDKQNLQEIVKNRLLTFGVESNKNVISLITNNDRQRNDKHLVFTSNYYSSNIYSTIIFDRLFTPYLINLPASILYDLHEI